MSISRDVLQKYVKPGTTFVETGTRWGTTALRAIDCGARIYVGCESDWRFAFSAKEMLCEVFARLLERREIKITVVHCESKNLLSYATQFFKDRTSDEKMMVFLDAHTDSHSPILDELAAIKGWNPEPDLLLVDDVRLFRSGQWGITLEQVIDSIDRIGRYEYGCENGYRSEDIL